MAEERKLSKKERRELRRQEKKNRAEATQSSRTKKRAVIWITTVLVIGGAVFGIVKLASAPSHDGGNGASSDLSVAVSDKDWTKGGDETAPVTLVEYSDLQCPACGAYFPVLKQLTKEFGNQVRFVYRHFPISRIHPQSLAASYAAEAAGLQGKFWEMHDMIFEGQQDWSRRGSGAKAVFRQMAVDLGLDIEKYDKDIKSDAVRDKVSSQYQSGIASKVNSTPSFFLNGKKIQNPRTFEAFKQLISSTIAETYQIGRTATTTESTSTTTVETATTTP